ncbi:hypothetical protein C8F04DRAFT_1185105 [Mycena alexandri]|uniref:Uncharacterized protein n=1 Tax=Mycena alexandri TaxID=1745969 RepID=A0AAD6SRT8_9AGAR|nr:hypothetical protein C8F04DRAFT_1185105 [Mycena alexandri]
MRRVPGRGAKRWAITGFQAACERSTAGGDAKNMLKELRVRVRTPNTHGAGARRGQPAQTPGYHGGKSRGWRAAMSKTSAGARQEAAGVRAGNHERLRAPDITDAEASPSSMPQCLDSGGNVGSRGLKGRLKSSLEKPKRARKPGGNGVHIAQGERQHQWQLGSAQPSSPSRDRPNEGGNGGNDDGGAVGKQEGFISICDI